MVDYAEFLDRKTQYAEGDGFEPHWMPDQAFDFQRYLIDWAQRKGRAALFTDCGTGKSLMELTWAQNVVRETNRPVLLLTPLAVANQMCQEASKFGVEASLSKDGSHSGGIVVSNYEKLHLFNEHDFSGVVCDESSILKSFAGKRQKQITRFMNKKRFRLLATATAAPNDWVELGTSSGALGELPHSDMLKRFFRQLDDKGQKKEQRLQNEAEQVIANDPNYYQKLAYRVAQTIGQWRLKHHAVPHFWKWVASWARACRMPSDLGFDDGGFVLPELIERDHIIEADTPPPGMLFNTPAFGLGEEREERKRTLRQRCEYVAELVSHDRPSVVWCHNNDEGDLLEEIISESRQIAGRTPDERRVELYDAFSSGELKRIIIKAKIGAWGLNWQHCHDVVSFASHSFEQHYQSVRRCWRFGQKHPVTVDVVATEGEARVLANMRRKGEKAEAMFKSLVKYMNDATTIERVDNCTQKVELPSWL